MNRMVTLIMRTWSWCWQVYGLVLFAELIDLFSPDTDVCGLVDKLDWVDDDIPLVNWDPNLVQSKPELGDVHFSEYEYALNQTETDKLQLLDQKHQFVTP